MRFFVLLGLAIAACSPFTPTLLEGEERQQTQDNYTASLTEMVMARWQPRAALRDFPNSVLSAGTLTTVVWVVVDELGDVVINDVAKSAAPFLDREALRAIQSAGPFPPPPAGLLTRSSRGLVAGFPIQFDIKVPGQPGTFPPARALIAARPPTMLKPLLVSVDL